MFSDRINRIDLIFFHGFHLPATLSLARRAGMKPRKHNSASAEKKGRGVKSPGPEDQVFQAKIKVRPLC
jgi:hypothetical protein